MAYAAFNLVPPDYRFDAFDGAQHDVTDGYRLRALHECGAVTVVVVAARELVSAERAVDIIRERLFGSCYCVRREVLVPCTAQRCE
jgi:hypothetical protein